MPLAVLTINKRDGFCSVISEAMVGNTQGAFVLPSPYVGGDGGMGEASLSSPVRFETDTHVPQT